MVIVLCNDQSHVPGAGDCGHYPGALKAANRAGNSGCGATSSGTTLPTRPLVDRRHRAISNQGTYVWLFQSLQGLHTHFHKVLALGLQHKHHT